MRRHFFRFALISLGKGHGTGEPITTKMDKAIENNGKPIAVGEP